MVWKIGSVPAGAGIAGRDRLFMRRRFADALERRRHVRRPAAFQEEASHLLGLSKDACRERSGLGADCNAVARLTWSRQKSASLKRVSSGRSRLSRFTATTTCARRQIPLIPRRLRIWITMPGLVLLQCGLITAWFTPAAGGRLWSMGTALWVTCASTCLI